MAFSENLVPMRRRVVRWVVGLGAAVGLAVAVHPAHAVVAPSQPKVFRFPVILFSTWWDQEAGQTGPQFQAGDDAAHYQSVFDGFGGNPTGSLTEYYDENSDGQFLVQVDVYGPYTSNLSALEGPCYYGGIDPPDDPLDDLDTSWLVTAVFRHQSETGSEVAGRILSDWQYTVPQFVKVMPRDYKRVLSAIKAAEEAGSDIDDAIMAAFEENVKGGH